VQSLIAKDCPGLRMASYWLNVTVNALPSGLMSASQVPAGQPLPFAVTLAKYAPLGFGTSIDEPSSDDTVSVMSSSGAPSSAAQPAAPTQGMRATSERPSVRKSFMGCLQAMNVSKDEWWKGAEAPEVRVDAAESGARRE